MVNSQGRPVRLIGVDFGDSNFYCEHIETVAYPQPDTQATVSALVAWHVDAVRLFVVQDCWLGKNNEPRKESVSSYRMQIESLVRLLNNSHIEVLLTMGQTQLSTAGTSGKRSKGKTDPYAGPDTLSPEFWESVAGIFKDYPGVMFDLMNEPQDITWPCWKSGCNLKGEQYVGMQQLVDAVRSTGARQPLVLEGTGYATDMGDWLQYEPTDPDHQLIASFHTYDTTACHDRDCWQGDLHDLGNRVPLIIGEFGDQTCSPTYPSEVEKWADRNAVSYLIWSWSVNSKGCSGGGSLLSAYPGTPSKYGTGFKDHVVALYQAGHGNVAFSDTTPKRSAKSAKRSKKGSKS